jgi:predicted aminopeptidase
MRKTLALACVLLASACQTLEFYRQAATGQISILVRREPISKVIAAPDTSPRLRERLQKVRQILEFAHARLALDPDGRYTSYVHRDGAYVVWNVFAAPEFSTRPTQWCYPLIGCASYRGYFDRAEATRYAQRLAATQHDTVVGGVAAYSTLGWFDDPVLSTFVDWPDPELAGLLFHELAHARLFVPGDTAFNEAFASFVERRGVDEWLAASGDAAQIERTDRRWRESDRFVSFLLAWRDELQRLYDQQYNDDARRLLKFELLNSLETCYRSNRAVFGDQDWFFGKAPNNARFVPLAAYNELIAGFDAVFREAGRAWPAFYAQAREIGRLPIDERTADLERRGAQVRAAHDASAATIACEALRF